MNEQQNDVQWAIDLMEPHLDKYDEGNRSAPYFAKAIRILIEHAKDKLANTSEGRNKNAPRNRGGKDNSK